jgi:2-iminobutanoate/2-iminopropanoate deaminase
MQQIIQTESAPAPIGPYNQAVRAGAFLFVSGQISLNPLSGEMIQDTIENETRQVLNNIKAILEKAGMNFSQIVKITIFLKDMNDFAQVNGVYGTFFSDNFPARETVQVSRLPKDANVEISVIAFNG